MANRINTSPLTGRIFSGRVNKAGNAWVGEKQDATSDVLRAVVEKAAFHGGSFEVEAGTRKWVVTVTEAGSTGGAETAAVAQVVADDDALPFRKVAWLGRDLPVGTMLYAASSAPAQAVETATQEVERQIAAALSRAGLTLLKKADGYEVRKLGPIVAQGSAVETAGARHFCRCTTMCFKIPGCPFLDTAKAALQSPAASPASKEDGSHE